MLLGDAQVWLDRFTTLDDRLLERIVAVWPACIGSLGSQPLEDAITIALVDRLSVDSVVRRICYFIAYQHEPFGLAPDGTKFSKGKIDFVVLFDWERERYLAYECKRLNVHNAGGRASLATDYVVDGMMRFITEQYAQDLPMGCMLGYVIDGDLPFAQQRVSDAIAAHGPLGLQDGPKFRAALGDHARFETRHLRSGGSAIDLRHTFLACAWPRQPDQSRAAPS